MRRILVITAVVGVAAALVLAAVRAAPVRSVPALRGTTPAGGAAKDAYVALPLRFEPNVGQADDGVTVPVARPRLHHAPDPDGRGSEAREARRANTRPPGHLTSKPAEQAVIGLTFDGANPDALVAGRGRLDSVSNYLLGSDPDRWFTGVPNYSRVFYRDLYDGVSLE